MSKKVETRQAAVEGVDPQIREKAAFERLLPKYQALDKAELQSVRTDIRRSAAAAIGLAVKLKEPAIRERFALLPKELFDQSLLDELEPAALAASWAKLQADAAGLISEPRISAELLDEGQALKRRMLKVADYWLGDHPQAAPRIAYIRTGTGYLDLADDLIQLADLYDTYADVLRKDAKDYRAEDAVDAARAGTEIRSQVAAAKSDVAQGLLVRSWTHLFAVHEEIRAAGSFLFRNQRESEMFANSLVTAGRAPHSRKPPVEPPAPPAGSQENAKEIKT